GSEEADGVAYTCYRPRPFGHPKLRFCCSDIGQGFFVTLNRKTPGAAGRNDVTAILNGLLYRHSHEADRVVGLFDALGFIWEFQGAVSIHSGNALVTIDFRSPANRTLFERGLGNPSLSW